MVSTILGELNNPHNCSDFLQEILRAECLKQNTPSFDITVLLPLGAEAVSMVTKNKITEKISFYSKTPK